MPVTIRSCWSFLACVFSFCSILILLLLNSAYAEWVEVTRAERTKGDSATMYMDPDTFRSRGTRVKVWGLTDYKVTHTNRDGTYLSVKVQMEYDCAEEQFRVLAGIGYAGPMGIGEVVFSDTKPSDWFPVVPGTPVQEEWAFACKK